MHVVVGTSVLSGAHKHRGVGSYTRQLIEALKRVEPESRFTLTSQPNDTDADLVHYPFFDLYFLTLPVIKNHPTVVTIHDAIPLIYPEQHRPGIRGRLKLLIQRYSLNGVQKVITDSHTSKSDISEYLGQSESKITVVPLAAAAEFKPLERDAVVQVLEKYGLRKPYLLYVGDINYNKNVVGLVKAVAELDSIDLVLVSRALENDIPEAREIRKMIDKLKLNKRVHVLTDVPLDPKTDLVSIYNGAEWYVQPSFYEGFGLPILEAMACGTPVVSSIGGSLSEVASESAIMFDPTQSGAITGALGQALSGSKSERQGWIDKGLERASQFSWDKAARKTIEVYRELLR